VSDHTAPERIWANVAVWGNGEPLAGEWNYRDVGNDDDVEYIRADLAVPRAEVAAKDAEIERLTAECARRDKDRAELHEKMAEVKARAAAAEAVIDVEREARREVMDLLVAHTQAQEALERAVQAEAEVERLRNLLGHVLRLDKEIGTNSTIHDIARDALNEKENG